MGPHGGGAQWCTHTVHPKGTDGARARCTPPGLACRLARGVPVSAWAFVPCSVGMRTSMTVRTGRAHTPRGPPTHTRVCIGTPRRYETGARVRRRADLGAHHGAVLDDVEAVALVALRDDDVTGVEVLRLCESTCTRARARALACDVAGNYGPRARAWRCDAAAGGDVRSAACHGPRARVRVRCLGRR